MLEHRVIGVEPELGSGDARDPHVAVLCLDDGRRMPNLRAISNIKYGIEAYYTEAVGRRARVRVVGPCDRCGLDYLRADDVQAHRDTLLTLPPCAPVADVQNASGRRETASDE